MKINKTILLIIGILISILAEVYSIYGLSRLLSGYKLAAIAMGISFGIAKLVIAMALKVYWSNFQKPLRIYLLIAMIILSIITSIGIYGLLLDGYNTTKTKDDFVIRQTELIKRKKIIFEDNCTQLHIQLQQINQSSTNLLTNLATSNQTQQVIGGKVITNISNGNKTPIQNQLDKLYLEKEKIENKIFSLTDSIQNIELIIMNVEQANTASSEIGPLKFIANIFGIGMDTFVVYLFFLLVIVFDPLALALIWASFSTVEVEIKKTNTSIDGIQINNDGVNLNNNTDIDVESSDLKLQPSANTIIDDVFSLKKSRGRPKGSKNKFKPTQTIFNNDTSLAQMVDTNKKKL